MPSALKTSPEKALSLAQYATNLLVVEPVCALANVIAKAASRGSAWASLGGLPHLPPACAAMRHPEPGHAFLDFSPGLAAWRSAHGLSVVLHTLIFACVIIPVGRVLAEMLFDAVGRRVLVCGEGRSTPSRAKLQKWREASWKLSSYGALTAFGLSVTFSQPWARNTQLLWEGWPQDHDHSCVPRARPLVCPP
jgi:hypothetical protein